MDTFHAPLQDLTVGYAKPLSNTVGGSGLSASTLAASLRGSAGVPRGVISQTGAISAEAATDWKVGWAPAPANTAADRRKDNLESGGYCLTTGLQPDVAERGYQK